MADMARAVKGRHYNAATRQASSLETRARVLAAAREAIVECGYRGATVAGIAARAAVNVDTVYELVGRKPVLLRELIEQAISGTGGAVDAEERDYVMAIRAKQDPREKLRIYARSVSLIQARLAPLFLALRDTCPLQKPRRKRCGRRSATAGQPTCGSLPMTSRQWEVSAGA